MKTLFNSVPTLVVSNFKQPTTYPKEVIDSNGKKVIVHQVVDNSEINKDLDVDSYRLANLINAGIDPSKISISTTGSIVENYHNLNQSINSLPSDFFDTVND